MGQVTVDLSSVVRKLAAHGFTPVENQVLWDRVKDHYETGAADAIPGLIVSLNSRILQTDIPFAAGPVTLQASYSVHWPQAGKIGPQATVLKVQNVIFP
jgi:hypothetical protein